MLLCRNSRTSHLTPPHFRRLKQKRHVWARDDFVNQKDVVMVTSGKRGEGRKVREQCRLRVWPSRLKKKKKKKREDATIFQRNYTFSSRVNYVNGVFISVVWAALKRLNPKNSTGVEFLLGSSKIQQSKCPTPALVSLLPKGVTRWTSIMILGHDRYYHKLR